MLQSLAKDGTRMGGIWFRLSPSNNSIERGVKLDDKAPFHCKFLIVFADDIGLTIRSDLVRLEHVLCFSKIKGSIIT